jgi:exodeoxyribonuclease V alpha subunit
MLVIFDDDREVYYEFTQLDELVLSYAVTVHKSQGSEFPVVVMPLFNIPPMLRNKNILYTAITRAKSLVVLVGSEMQLHHMINNISSTKRNSGLIYMFNLVKEAYQN